MERNKPSFAKATVGGIILSGDRVLMARRNHQPFIDHWCFPGGHIDFGEKAVDALQREIQEETGLRVTDSEFLCFIDEIYPEQSWHAVALIFVVRVSGEERRQESEVRELQWVPVSRLMSLRLAFEGPRVIESFRRKYSHLPW